MQKFNKKRKLFSIICIASILLLSSCSNLLIGKADGSRPVQNTEYGNLYVNKISGRTDDGSRALYVSEIEGASVTLSGKGMVERKKDVTVSSGIGNVSFESIPVGKNRVVTVEAKRSINNVITKMDGIVMRAVTDIVSGSNNVNVTWASTAVGNVFYELINTQNYDVSDLSVSTVQNLIPADTHASLVDTARIAADIKNGTPNSADAYKLESGSVSFTADITNASAIVQVCDPVSAKVTGLTNGSQSIQNVAPGTWNLYVILDGSIVFQKEITVASGAAVDAGSVTLKTPAPRLENADGSAITNFIQTGASGSKKTVYFSCRTFDGEAPVSDAVIYYTADGSVPTALSAQYTSSGIEIPADLDVTVKAFSKKNGLVSSDVVTYEFKRPSVGYTYPLSGAYSPVDKNGVIDGFGWNFTSKPGAEINGDGNVVFAVYSKNATAVLLEIYDAAYGTDAKYDYWMEKGSDNFWRAELNSVPAGTLYAFRCWGPNWTYSDLWERGNSSAGFASDYDATGNRFNPNKVLFDPYAKEMSHDKSNPIALGGFDGGMYGTGGDQWNGIVRRNVDTGKYAPKSVLVQDSSSSSYGAKPVIAQKDAIIYEAHVRGLTKHSSSANLSSILNGIDGFGSVADIPADKQGTYAGAALMAPYLKALGINTIELLPVHETDNDSNPDDSPGGNFWGYMTYGYFAPDRRYSSDKSYGGPTKEFKEMVKTFHDAGIEVYLDVVFNHSGEGGPWFGSTDNYNTAELTFLRGFDCSEYYCLTPSNVGDHWNTTGCGNNLRCDNPIVRKLILDSLLYWIDEMGVDGFRFDLAPVLGRVSNASGWPFSASARTIIDIMSLGAAKNVEMVAEAWDIGDYEVGKFPSGWGEWNGRFRDAIRSYVGSGTRGSLNDYIYGDYNNFNDQGGPHKSVNFVVAHDGFTLADLCSYQGAGNALNGTLAWPFGPSDGGNSDYNSLGFGTGAENKRQAARNYIALQMISRGVPMIVYGDELSRTQNGNNNPYNIDSVATWNNYNMINTSSPHAVPTGGGGTYHNNFGTFDNTNNVNGNFLFMKYMMNLRASEPALRQDDYTVSYTFKKEDGSSTLGGGDKCVWIRIGGSQISGGSDYLVFSNMYTAEIPYTIPAAAGKKWILLVDTASSAESDFNCYDPAIAATVSSSYGVKPWSVVILKQVSDQNAVLTVEKPVISGNSYFTDSTAVTITCGTGDAVIRYTTDGSAPTEASSTYTEAITLTNTATVKAKAFKSDYIPSAVASKTFTKGTVPAAADKSGVMLQGFNWASAPRGASDKWYQWYGIMQAQASGIGETFEYVWFPPPSKTDTASSEGYGPTELNDLNNCYGTEEELKAVINAIKPAKAIADVVVNHRTGSTCWGDFQNPDWGVVKGSNYQVICSDDEGFTGDVHMSGVSASMRGTADTGDAYSAYRDIDHTSSVVQQGIIDWMNGTLRAAGFAGWRYDYVKGFAGRYVGQYNAGSSAEFSVGEYWPTAGFSSSNPSAWGDEIKSWISATAENGGLRSRAFDFALKGILNTVFGSNASNVVNSGYGLLANAASLMISQPSDAVTFIDNHDTGSTQAHWYLDPADVGIAYAFILTHPGVPCVAWQHYFTDAESGNYGDNQYIGGNTVPGTSNSYRQHIDYLINLRKTVGIEYDDTVMVLDSSPAYYAAKITGTSGELVVVIGNGYTPTGEGYAGNGAVYSGTDFAVWQKGVNGGNPAETVNLTVTANDWTWGGGVKVFAWCFGNTGSSYGSGKWIECSGSGTTVNLSCNNDITGFLLVRCPAETTTPDWTAAGDSSGRIYNKTADIPYVPGTVTYTAAFTDYAPAP